MAGIPSRVEPPNAYAAPSSAPGGRAPPNYLVPLAVLTTLFFMWGGLTSLNDVLIPHLKGIFSLSYFEAMLVQFCFFGAYGLMSIPAGLVREGDRLQEGDHRRPRGRGGRLPAVLSGGGGPARTACSCSRCSCSRPAS